MANTISKCHVSRTNNVVLILGVGRSETSDLDVSEEENAKRAEQMRRPSGHQAKGEVVYEQFPVSDSDDDEDSANSMPIRQQAGSNLNGSKAGPISLPPSKPNVSSATVSLLYTTLCFGPGVLTKSKWKTVSIMWEKIKLDFPLNGLCNVLLGGFDL